MYTPRSILKDTETESEYPTRTRFFMDPRTAKLPSTVSMNSLTNTLSKTDLRWSKNLHFERSNSLQCRGEDVETFRFMDDLKQEDTKYRKRSQSLDVDSLKSLDISFPYNGTDLVQEVVDDSLLEELRSAMGHYTMLSSSLNEFDSTGLDFRSHTLSAAGETQTWNPGDTTRSLISEYAEPLTQDRTTSIRPATDIRRPIKKRYRRVASRYGQLSMAHLNSNPSTHETIRNMVRFTRQRARSQYIRTPISFRKLSSPTRNKRIVRTSRTPTRICARPMKRNLAKRLEPCRYTTKRRPISLDNLSERQSRKGQRVSRIANNTKYQKFVLKRNPVSSKSFTRSKYMKVNSVRSKQARPESSSF